MSRWGALPRELMVPELFKQPDPAFETRPQTKELGVTGEKVHKDPRGKCL